MNSRSIFFALIVAFACFFPTDGWAQTVDYQPEYTNASPGSSTELQAVEPFNVIVATDSYPATLSQPTNQVYSVPKETPSTAMYSEFQPRAAVCTASG